METLSDCVFAQMRRELAPRLGVCEQALRPETPLWQVLPRERRRELWRSLERELGLRLPTLQLPPALERIQSWLTIVSIFRTIVGGALFGPKLLVWPLLLVGGAAIHAVFHVITRPWATEHPDLETFGDLLRWLLARNMKRFRTEFRIQPNRDEIYITLRAMLIEHGARPAAITPDASLTDLLEC